jgi:hypothetical protein
MRWHAVADAGTKMKTQVEHRTWPRMKCELDAGYTANALRVPCRIIDFSERGLGIVMTKPLEIGEVIDLEDPMIKAVVVWSRDGRAGLRLIYDWDGRP